jgi:hypothetical protein
VQSARSGPFSLFDLTCTMCRVAIYRINKKNSQKDMEQKKNGNYFFYDEEESSSADVDDDDL